MAYNVEQPLQGEDAAAANAPLIDAVTKWLNAQLVLGRAAKHRGEGGLARGGDFAAVFGGRGAGKSSILEGIRHTLARSPDFAVLPPFCPEELPEEAELVSALVLHLEGGVCLGGATGKKGGFDEERRPSWGEASAEIWRALAERRSPLLFQRVDEQLASSPANFRDRLVEGYKRHGALHHALRSQVHAWIGAATKPPKARSAANPTHFVLLIDDIDLVHYRAWDLLDCLNHCFRHPQLSVVVFADEPMLIEGLTSGVRGADRNLSEARAREVATAMGLKILPVRFRVPTLTESERVQRLAELKIEERQVPDFWSLWLPEGADRDGARPTAASLGPELLSNLGAVLPDNARQLKALRTRWVGGEIPPVGLSGDDRAHLRFGFAFESIALQVPSLPVRQLTTRHIAELRRAFRSAQRIGSSGPAQLNETGRGLLADLIEKLDTVEKTDATQLMNALWVLANRVSDSEARRREARTRGVLHLSLYDARGGELDQAGSPDFGERSTIDLQLFRPEGGKTVPAALVPEVVHNLDEALRAQPGLIALEKPSITLIAAAPLSVLVYLGWRLRRYPVKAFLNQHAGAWARYLGDLQGDGAERSAPLWRQDSARQFAGAAPGADDLAIVLSTRPDATAALDGLPDSVKARCAFGTVLISTMAVVPGAGASLPEVPWAAPEHAVDRDSDAYADAMILPRLVWQARDWIVAQRQRHRTGTLHLLLSVPAPLAFYLGGHLHALQPIQLYEYEGGRYLPTVRLDTGESDAQLADDWAAPGPEPAASAATTPGADTLPAAAGDDDGTIARRRALNEE